MCPRGLTERGGPWDGNPCIDKGRRTFLREGAQIYINFEEILSHVHGNSDEQNKALEPSITIINYCIIIIIIYIVKLMHSIIIVFAIKASSWNAMRTKLWK
jgi:hypothetical protein